jgi:hypothetical protein
MVVWGLDKRFCWCFWGYLRSLRPLIKKDPGLKPLITA